jgi:hypothetical protein
MARRRKPGRPKSSKNKKRSKSRKKGKATPAQLRNLKKARAVRAKNLKKAGKKKRKTKTAWYESDSATAAILRNMPGVRVGTKKKKAGKKPGRKSATYHKRVENLKKARAARELKNMPKTKRMKKKAQDYLSALYAGLHDEMADTVRAPRASDSVRHPHPTSMPSILLHVRRRPSPTLVSNH